MPTPVLLLLLPLLDASAVCEVREVEYCVYHVSFIRCDAGRRAGNIHKERY